MSNCDVLKDRGIKLSLVGDKLRLSPKEKVTAEILEFTRTHKKKIIDELRKNAEAEKLFKAYQAMWRKVSLLYREGKLPEGFEYEILLLDRKVDTQAPDAMQAIQALNDELQRIEN